MEATYGLWAALGKTNREIENEVQRARAGGIGQTLKTLYNKVRKTIEPTRFGLSKELNTVMLNHPIVPVEWQTAKEVAAEATGHPMRPVN